MEYIEKICEAYGFDKVEFLTKRNYEYMRVKHLLIYLLFINGFYMTQLGILFNRDHSTISYIIKEMAYKIGAYKEYQKEYEKIKGIIYANN